MKWRISHWSIATRLLLINLSAILVLGGILVTSFYLFKNIERLVTGIVRKSVPQVLVNSRAGEELTSIFAELLVDISYGREEVVKIKSTRFEQVINQLFKQETATPRLQESLNEFMKKLAHLNDQSVIIQEISEKLKKTENEIIYSFEVLQDIIDEEIETLSLGAEDPLTMRYMEQLKSMNTRYRGVFLDITIKIVELKRDNIQSISELQHPVISDLDYFHLELQTLLAADPEIRNQGKKLIQLILDYKGMVTRLVHTTAQFNRQLAEVRDSKENIMNVFKEVNEYVAEAARDSQEYIEASLQSSGRIIIFLSAAVFVVISLITYSVFNMFKELQKRTAELAEATEVAEAANVAKSEFLARMSHEIRTPLNAVTGLTNIVLKSELTTGQRDNLNKVQIAGGNLLAVINDILDFSKVEAGRLELEQHPFNLNQLLEKLADLFSNRVAQKDLELIFAVAPDTPQQLIGDAARLTQVLTNLIENAVKFTKTGEIVISVEIAVRHDEQITLKFKISDTGIGIAADVLPTLFEPFIQADNYLTRKHEGAGLGLAICRRLVELMGGTIEAQSTLGKGSTFSFTAKLKTSKEKRTTFSLSDDLRGLKILVVDDSDIARQVLSNLLESLKFNVTAVDGGEKALKELRRSETDNPYQLVILDWKMPGMDGIETATAIYNDLKLHNPPIIILVTAYGRELVQERINTSIVDTMLLKPVKPSQLFDTIMELFGRTKIAEAHHAREPVVHLTDQLSDQRVLIVEDSELNREVAVALLEETGLIVETAENGQIAVNMVTGSTKDYYNALFMDIQMPVMDGYEATRKIREFEKKQNLSADQPETKIPIIALTAHALKGEKEKCLNADMDDYLSKPIDEQELHRILLKWIPSRQDEGYG